MAIPLKIKALCINIGYAESARTSCMFVHWRGRPFTDAREALTSFMDECKRVCQEAVPELEDCCKKTLARNAKAKACESCGDRMRRQDDARSTPIDDYLQELVSASCDGFNEVAFPYGADEDAENNSGHVGRWEFFQGMPVDCDVVEVNCLDYAFADSGRMKAEFSVIHVGKAATRATANGKFP